MLDFIQTMQMRVAAGQQLGRFPGDAKTPAQAALWRHLVSEQRRGVRLARRLGRALKIYRLYLEVQRDAQTVHLAMRSRTSLIFALCVLGALILSRFSSIKSVELALAAFALGALTFAAYLALRAFIARRLYITRISAEHILIEVTASRSTLVPTYEHAHLGVSGENHRMAYLEWHFRTLLHKAALEVEQWNQLNILGELVYLGLGSCFFGLPFLLDVLHQTTV